MKIIRLTFLLSIFCCQIGYGKVHVKVTEEDIAAGNTGIISYAANGDLFFGGGTAGAIARKYDKDGIIQQKLDKLVKDNGGKFEPGTVKFISLDDGTILANIVAPNFRDPEDRNRDTDIDLEKGYYETLKKGKDKESKTARLSALSTGIFADKDPKTDEDRHNVIPKSAQAAKKAIERFEKDFPNIDLDVTFCIFKDPSTYKEFKKVLEDNNPNGNEQSPAPTVAAAATPAAIINGSSWLKKAAIWLTSLLYTQPIDSKTTTNIAKK